MTRVTHEGKVLALLSDGKPHSHMEGYRLGVMLHSRVSGLRKKGFRIECDKTGGQYVYTLISRPLEGGAGTSLGVPSCHAPASPSSERGLGVLPDNDRVDTNVQSPAPLDPSVLPDGQLTLRWAA